MGNCTLSLEWPKLPLFLDIKSIFDVLDQVSVTATAADVRTNELIDAQNNLTKGLQDQGDRFDNFESQMSILTEELRNFEGQAGDGGKGGFLIRYHTHM